MEPVHAIAATVGFASMALLWLALLAGLALARGWMMTSFKHSTMLAIHHSLALLGLTLGLVHGAAQPLGPAQTVKFINVVVPFTNYLDPIGIGIGVIGTELMVALVLSVGIQRMLGFHRWRALHSIAYASYTLVTGHVLISGAEVEGWMMQAAVLVPWLIIIGLWLVGGSGNSGAPPAPQPPPGEASERGGSGRTSRPVATVQVNPGKCAKFGFCEQEAPELFNLRADGQLAYRALVGEQQLDQAERAVRACPTRAIAMLKSGNGGRVVAPLAESVPAAQINGRAR
jgi:ferredoxin/DMSO/TMAO reductase YedYZ heme-binding membrane subunit